MNSGRTRQKQLHPCRADAWPDSGLVHPAPVAVSDTLHGLATPVAQLAAAPEFESEIEKIAKATGSSGTGQC